MKRYISALVWAPLLLGLSYLGGIYTAVLVSILTVLALLEFLNIVKRLGITVWYKLTIAFACIWLLNMFFGNKEWMMPILICWLIMTFGRLALQYPKVNLEEASYNLLGLIYPVAFYSYLYLLRQLPQGAIWTFFTLFLVWSTDTLAYLIGRGFGHFPLRRKLVQIKLLKDLLAVYWGVLLLD